MADPVVSPLPADTDVEFDEVLRRRVDFLNRLGIPTPSILLGVLQPSIAHALAAPVDTPPRPWAALGGRNIGGHVHSLAQDPTNPATIFAGTAWGGVWVTRNAGDTWAPLGTPQDSLPVGAIALAPSNPRILYVGTGETITLRLSSPLSVPPSGLGFYRCDTSVAVPRFVQEVGAPPAGAPGPAGSADTYSRIIVDPHNAERCWIASSSGLWRREAGPVFHPEPVPVRTTPVLHATDVALAENWSSAPQHRGTYRIWVGYDGEGVFRGVYDPAVGGNVVWDLAGAGTIATDAAGTAVTGTGTNFRTFFRVGDLIHTTGLAPDRLSAITAIADDTHLTVAPAFAPALAAGTRYFRVAPGFQPAVGTVAIPAPGAPGAPIVVNGAGTNFLADVRIGDEFRTTGLGAGNEVIDIVAAVPNNTTLTLSPNVPAAVPVAAGTRYEIQPSGGIGLPNGPGTISTVVGTTAVTGVGTAFPAFFNVGDEIRSTPLLRSIPMQLRTVTAVPNATNLTVNAPFDPPLPAGTTYARQPAAGSGFPGFGGFGRVRIAVCKSRPEHVYALLANSDPGTTAFMLPLMHSSDGGDTWHTMNTAEYDWPNNGAQSWYSLTLAVHPFDPGLVLAGAVNLYRSLDFGASWAMVLNWLNYDNGDRAQHADHHDMIWDAFEPGKLWLANDGGVSMAPDMPNGNPSTSRGWRKRSHGILAAQFNDITVHQTYPFIMGGGLQDNGSYMSLGGPTWYHVGPADGGEMEFEPRNPRQFYAPWQNAFNTTTIVAGNTPAPVGLPQRFIEYSPVNPDQAPPNDVFASQNANLFGVPLFVVVQAHHPTAPGHIVVGDRGAGSAVNPGNSLIISNNGGANFFLSGIPNFAGNVSTLTFSANGRDLWVGTTIGGLFRGAYPAVIPPAPAGVPAIVWTAVAAPAFPAPNPLISRIAVHPADPNYIAISTAGNSTPAGTQGGVFLSLDQGANWADVTGLAAVGAPPLGGPALQSLPPCPVASLAFDPSTPAAGPQVLFAGTVVGVYVIRNLPPRRVPAAAGAVPPFRPSWVSFNNRQLPSPPAPLVPGQLPLVLVNDLVCHTLPPTPGAVAGTPEAVPRQKLICSSFGRGMYECDLTQPPVAAVAGGGPQFRIYMRQYSVEDGLGYPRLLPAALNAAPVAAPAAAGPGLNGDPRMPAATVLFNMTSAFDIRIDSPPFTIFDEVVDGVEFDEDLGIGILDPGELNMVYVQVHTRGWDNVSNVVVQLYFAPAPVPGAVPLPDLHADFWAHVNDLPVLPPPAAAVVAPAAAWQRTGPPVPISNVRPTQPVVARFEWVPPASLAGAPVALLALCTSPSDPIAIPGPTVMQTLLTNERRAAMRVANVGPFTPDIFIRDGVEDRGRAASVAYGGRSPDIIVVQGAPAQALDVAFRDLADRRPQDRLLGGVDNLIYVRVHNRKREQIQAQVELWWVKATMPFAAADANTPPFDQTKWSQAGIVGDVPPLPSAISAVTVPPRGWATARFVWNSPPDPDPAGGADKYPVYLLIALINAVPALDPRPIKTDADTFENFWNFFRTARNAGNAAMRGVRWSLT